MAGDLVAVRVERTERVRGEAPGLPRWDPPAGVRPFVRGGVATAEVIQFRASQSADGLAALL